jgi:hypothetical protein
MTRSSLSAAALAVTFLLLCACTPYKSQQVPFRPPSAFSGMQVVAGAQVAAQAYVDEKDARDAFGFNIRKAGLLPVQIVIDHQGTNSLTIVPGQTFLIDATGNYWNLLDGRTAYERLEKSSEFASIAKGAGKGSVLGAAGGAIVGAAIGILTGENIGETLGKGAAIGAAGGAVLGGTEAGGSGEVESQISRDLANKQLENRPLEPGMLSRGFLFFPGEATSATQLRLQVKETGGPIHNLTLPLQ